MPTTDLAFLASRPFVHITPIVSPQQAEADRLGDAIAELASRIHAATYELLVLIRQFDACAAGTTAACPARTG
jgi:hypothetical protein